MRKRRRAPKLATLEELDRLLPKNPPPPRDAEAAQRLIERVHGPGTFSDELATAAAWRDAELRLEVEEELRREQIRRELEAEVERATPRRRPGPAPAIPRDVWMAHVHEHPLGLMTWKQRVAILSAQLGRRITVHDVRNAKKRAEEGGC